MSRPVAVLLALILLLLSAACAPRTKTAAVERGPTSAELVERAARLSAGQRFTEAVALLDEALETDPADRTALLERAYAHLRRGDALRAEMDFGRAIELDPADPWARAGRGLARSLAGRHEGAVEDYTAALDREPENATALLNRGFSRARLGEHVLAVEDFSRVVGKDDDPLALYYRARSLAALGRPVQASLDYARIFSLRPGQAAGAQRALLGPEPGALEGLLAQASREEDRGVTLPVLDCLARLVLGKDATACTSALR